MDSHPILVSPHNLSDQLGDNRCIVLDATIPVPGSDDNDKPAPPVIPGARYFDLEGLFSDPTSPYPHTMPNPQQFTHAARGLGINRNSHLVVYDAVGIFSAPRVWWMFRAMGHPSISILNGGLPEWQRAGFATAGDHAVAAIKGDFVAAPQSGYFVDIATVQGVLQQGQALIDARSAERFFGRVDEPRPGIRRGNIPGSHNLCFQNVLNHSGYLPIPELTQCFKGLQLDQNAPLIFSCGSGITACINAVAARLCGFEKVSVYDGSWCEWATVYPETSG